MIKENEIISYYSFAHFLFVLIFNQRPLPQQTLYSGQLAPQMQPPPSLNSNAAHPQQPQCHQCFGAGRYGSDKFRHDSGTGLFDFGSQITNDKNHTHAQQRFDVVDSNLISLPQERIQPVSTNGSRKK